MSNAFISAVKARRTFYGLQNNSPISNERINAIIEETILHTPSSFNSQSTRVLALFSAEHEKLWDMTKEAVKAIAPAEQWPATEKKLDGFRGGYGTILFYEDPQVIAELQKGFPIYSEKFPQWSEHTNAMHTFVLWTALEAEGLGANLQHYNPLIDQRVSKEWNIPLDWSLKGQLVFGKPVGIPKEKAFKPVAERVFVYGANP